MKWTLWLLVILTVAATIPGAHAAFRMQSTGSGLADFTGPTSFSYYGSEQGSSFVGGWDAQQISMASSTQRGGIALNVRRPSYVRQHTFADSNQNYRTMEYGDWQVQQLHANHKPSQSAFSYGNTPAGPQVSGYVGGYGGVNPRSVYAAGLSSYDRQYNTGMMYSPYTSPYRQPATLSARTAPRAYW